MTGNPVRDAVLAQVDKPYEVPTEGRIRLLVFGGSQGARVMTDVVPVALAALPNALRERLDVTQQCRPEDVDRVRATYSEANVAANLSAFFDNMPEEIAQAHLVIGRAGASSVSELAVIGRPSILVPLPHSLDQDQKANAEVLSSVGAAWTIEQNQFTPEFLSGRLESLFNHPNKLAQAAQAAKGQGKPDAVVALANLVEQIARRPKGALRAPEEQQTLTHSISDKPDEGKRS